MLIAVQITGHPETIRRKTQAALCGPSDGAAQEAFYSALGVGTRLQQLFLNGQLNVFTSQTWLLWSSLS